jgi:hypothetical protein
MYTIYTIYMFYDQVLYGFSLGSFFSFIAFFDTFPFAGIQSDSCAKHARFNYLAYRWATREEIQHGMINNLLI